MKQFLLSLAAGLIIGGAVMYFYMNTKLEKYNNLKEMSFLPKGKKQILMDIGRNMADSFVKNYQNVTGLPIKGLRFTASELASLIKPAAPGTDPDEIIVYFGKKSPHTDRKGDYTAIIAGIKNNVQQDGYYADQASPCPTDCPQNEIGN